MNNDVIATLLGEWSSGVGPASAALRFAVAIVFSALIGYERAQKRHAAGLRTFIVVALASVLAGMSDQYLIISSLGFPLISAASVVGMAVIVCNTILYSSKNQLKGLTTSVCLWTTGIFSVGLGLGQYCLALIGYAALILTVRLFPNLEKRIKQRSHYIEIHLELESRSALGEFVATAREFGLKVNDVEINPAFANTGLGVYSAVLKIDGDKLKGKTHAEIVSALGSLSYVRYVEEII